MGTRYSRVVCRVCEPRVVSPVNHVSDVAPSNPGGHARGGSGHTGNPLRGYVISVYTEYICLYIIYLEPI